MIFFFFSSGCYWCLNWKVAKRIFESVTGLKAQGCFPFENVEPFFIFHGTYYIYKQDNNELQAVLHNKFFSLSCKIYEHKPKNIT